MAIRVHEESLLMDLRSRSVREHDATTYRIQYSGRRSIRWCAGETRASIVFTEFVLEIVL